MILKRRITQIILCLCGCGREIIIKPHHKYFGVSKYIHGHNNRNKIVSDKTKKLLSKQKSGNKNPAKRPEVRTKISETTKANYIINPYAGNWQGGKSFKIYPKECSNKLKETIRKRDSRVCQLCHMKTKGNKEKWLSVFASQ